MLKTIIVSSIITSIVLLTGCCTLIDGRSQVVSIDTNAPAKYSIKNEDGEVVASGIAPAVVTLKRGDAPYTVSLKRADDQPEANGVITDNMNGYLWGNILLGGIIGTTVDFVNGAAYDLEPTVHIDTVGKSESTTIVPMATTPVTINNTINNKN